MLLFLDVKYYISSSLPSKLQSQLHLVLVDNGATQVPLDEATHIVTNSNQFEGWETVANHVVVVTDKWVTRSILAGKVQQPQFYSANPSMIFSGVIACTTGLSSDDTEVLSAGITALGGQWRTTLTRDVTHLFAETPGSEKYETALLFQEMTQVKVVLPQWFDDAIRLGTGSLPTVEYEWPNPRVLDTLDDQNIEGRSVSGEEDKVPFKTTLWTPGQDVPVIQAGQRDIWQQRRILLSPSLSLTVSRRMAFEAGIKRGNGVFIRYDAEEGNGTEEEAALKVSDADVFVTRHRSGAAYVKALKAHKVIGTLTWLFRVESTGIVSKPLDHLLHYPIPKGPIEGFSAHEITVTNYTGEAREYLKKLISAMGAQFTPNMSGRNTVLIAAYLSGNKATKARSWSIPIVNHTWLEDCFVQWRNLTVGLEKYIVFPPGVDFSRLFSVKGVGPSLADVDLFPHPADDIEGEVAAGNPEMKLPTGTDTSARDENEVEEVVGLFGGDDVFMDVGDSSPTHTNAQVQHNPSPTRPLKKRRHITPPDDDSFADIWQSTPRGITHSPRRPGVTSDNLVHDTAARSRKPTLLRSNEDDRSSPIDSPSNRKETHKLIDVESDDDLGQRRRRKLPTVIDEEANAEPELSSKTRLAGKMKAKPIKMITMESDDEDLPASTPESHEASNSKVESKASPERAVREAVAAKSSKEVPSVVIQMSRNAVPRRTESVVKVAGEAPSASRRRERPNLPSASSPSVPASDLSATLFRASTKRTAATRAIQKLHDEVMPDVLNFQQEMRSRAKGKGKERMQEKNSDDSSLPAPRAKYKAKDRHSDILTAYTSEEERRYAKKRKSSAAGTAESSVVTEEESAGDSILFESNKRVSAKSEKHTGKRSEKHSKDSPESNSGARPQKLEAGMKTIKLMTTQVNLSDDILKVLTKLGVKMTTKPYECTHLLAPHLVRTEKFLCALAVSPFILSEEWALESAAAKKLLPESNYILCDPANERKYKFSLGDVLDRAKKIGGHLFATHTFYVTPKVPVDLKLLKNVVTSGGGQLIIQPPTLRILNANSNRHVISCAAEASLWRPLAEHGYPIYTHELLLTGTLKQEVDWEDAAYRVHGSL